MGAACCKAQPASDDDSRQKHNELTSYSPASRANGAAPFKSAEAPGPSSHRAYPPSKANDWSEPVPYALASTIQEGSARTQSHSNVPHSSRSSVAGSPVPSHRQPGSEDAASSTAARSASERFLPDLRSPEQVDASPASKTGSGRRGRSTASTPRAGRRNNSSSGGAITHVHVHTKSNGTTSDAKVPLIKPLPATPTEPSPGAPSTAADRKARKSRSSSAVTPAPDEALPGSPRSPTSGSIGASPGADIALSPHRTMQWHASSTKPRDGERDVLVKSGSVRSGSGSKQGAAEAAAGPVKMDQLPLPDESIELNPAPRGHAILNGGVGAFGSTMSQSHQQGPPSAGASNPGLDAFARNPLMRNASVSHTRNLMSPYNEVDTTSLTEFAETSDLAAFAKPPSSRNVAGVEGRRSSGEPHHVLHGDLANAGDNQPSSFMAEDRGVWDGGRSGRGPVPAGRTRSSGGGTALAGDTVAFAPSGELPDGVSSVENSWFADARMPSLSPRPSPRPSARGPQLPALAEAQAATPRSASPFAGGAAAQGGAFMKALVSPRVDTKQPIESEFSAMADYDDEHRRAPGGGTSAAPRRATARARGGRARTASKQGSFGRGPLPSPDAPLGVAEHAASDAASSSASSRDDSPAESALRSPRVASVLDKMNAARRTVRRGGLRDSIASSPFERSGGLSASSRRVPSGPLLKRSGSTARMSEAVARLGSDDLEQLSNATPLTATSSARGRDSVRNRDLVQDSGLLSPQAEATMDRVLGGPAPSPSAAVPASPPASAVAASPTEQSNMSQVTLSAQRQSPQPAIRSAIAGTGGKLVNMAEGPLEPRPTPTEPLASAGADARSAVDPDASASAAAARVVSAAATAAKRATPGPRRGGSQGADAARASAAASVQAAAAALHGNAGLKPVQTGAGTDGGQHATRDQQGGGRQGTVERHDSSVSTNASAKANQQRPNDHPQQQQHQQGHQRTASMPAMAHGQPMMPHMQTPPGMAWGPQPMHAMPMHPQQSAPAGMMPEMMRASSMQGMPHPGMMAHPGMVRPGMGSAMTPPGQPAVASRSNSATGRGGPRSGGRGGAAPSPELKALLGRDNSAREHQRRLAAVKKQAQASHMQQMQSQMSQIQSQMRPGMYGQPQMGMAGMRMPGMHPNMMHAGMMQGHVSPAMWQQQAQQQQHLTPPPPAAGDLHPESGSAASDPAAVPSNPATAQMHRQYMAQQRAQAGVGPAVASRSTSRHKQGGRAGAAEVHARAATTASQVTAVSKPSQRAQSEIRTSMKQGPRSAAAMRSSS